MYQMTLSGAVTFGLCLAACTSPSSAFSPSTVTLRQTSSSLAAAASSRPALAPVGRALVRSSLVQLKASAKPSNAKETHTLEDGRVVYVMPNSGAISAAVVEMVAAIGSECINSKGSFNMCIPGGSIVKALETLSPTAMDFSKVHIFFANERIGEYKCYKGAIESFVDKCKIPHSQVHKVGSGEPGPVAEAYEDLMLSTCKTTMKYYSRSTTMPVFDIVLLGTGEDGHVGSLHPQSDEVKATGQGKIVLPIDKGGKKSIAVSMDLINCADNVIVGAAGAGRATMVKEALTGKYDKWNNPSALVMAKSTAWLCDTDSIAAFKAK